MQDYKCPKCGGTLNFDATVQKLKCPFCDSEYEIDDINLNKKDADVIDSLETNNGSHWSIEEKNHLKVYQCKSCGGEVVSDLNTVSSSCPFCGNNIVSIGQLEDDRKPDIIIPFKLDKKQAKSSLNKYIGNKKLLPRIFKNQNHIDEIKGVYVPFWLFDSDADAKFVFKANKERYYSDNDFDYKEISCYQINKEGSLSFEKIPVDGDSKIDDTIMESIEPYDVNQAVAFSIDYLAGYITNRYDVDEKASIVRANERINNSVRETFEKTLVGYNDVSIEESTIELSNPKIQYALYPVWLLTTTWNNKKYIFAMNGQTGKFVGDLPVDKGAAKKMQLLWTIGVSVGVYGLAWLLWLFNIL